MAQLLSPAFRDAIEGATEEQLFVTFRLLLSLSQLLPHEMLQRDSGTTGNYDAANFANEQMHLFADMIRAGKIPCDALEDFLHRNVPEFGMMNNPAATVSYEPDGFDDYGDVPDAKVQTYQAKKDAILQDASTYNRRELGSCGGRARLLREGLTCDHPLCTNTARVLCSCTNTGVLRCAQHDVEVHVFTPCVREVLLSETVDAPAVLHRLRRNDFLLLPSRNGGGVEVTPADLVNKTIPLSVSLGDACCPNCTSQHCKPSRWEGEYVVHDIQQGYVGGVVTKVLCLRKNADGVVCNTEWDVPGPRPIDKVGSDEYPLGRQRVTSLVSRGTVQLYVELQRRGVSGVSVEAMGRFLGEGVTRNGPDLAALRRMLDNAMASEALSLSALIGTSKPCLACDGKRVACDGNFKMHRLSSAPKGPGHNNVVVPASVMLPFAIFEGCLKALQEKNGESASICGTWKAASDSNVKNSKYDETGCMFAVCSHRAYHVGATIKTGERFIYHIVLIIMFGMLGGEVVLIDIACQLVQSINAQNIFNPRRLDAIVRIITDELAASLGEMTSDDKSTLCASLLPFRQDTTFTTAIHLFVAADSATIRKMANDVRDGLCSAADQMLMEVDTAAAGDPAHTCATHIEKETHVPPSSIACAASRMLEGLRSARDTQTCMTVALPAVHEYAHNCRQCMGGSVTEGAGLCAEWAEEAFANADIAKLAERWAGVGPLSWYMHWDATLSVYNQNLTRSLPYSLCRALVTRLADLEFAKDKLAVIQARKPEVTDEAIAARKKSDYTDCLHAHSPSMREAGAPRRREEQLIRDRSTLEAKIAALQMAITAAYAHKQAYGTVAGDIHFLECLSKSPALKGKACPARSLGDAQKLLEEYQMKLAYSPRQPIPDEAKSMVRLLSSVAESARAIRTEMVRMSARGSSEKMISGCHAVIRRERNKAESELWLLKELVKRSKRDDVAEAAAKLTTVTLDNFASDGVLPSEIAGEKVSHEDDLYIASQLSNRISRLQEDLGIYPADVRRAIVNVSNNILELRKQEQALHEGNVVRGAGCSGVSFRRNAVTSLRRSSAGSTSFFFWAPPSPFFFAL